MTDDKKTVTYEMDVFNPVLSQKLADLTQEFGLGRCHERAPAALEAAPAWMKTLSTCRDRGVVLRRWPGTNRSRATQLVVMG